MVSPPTSEIRADDEYYAPNIRRGARQRRVARRPCGPVTRTRRPGDSVGVRLAELGVSNRVDRTFRPAHRWRRCRARAFARARSQFPRAAPTDAPTHAHHVPCTHTAATADRRLTPCISRTVSRVQSTVALKRRSSRARRRRRRRHCRNNTIQ